MTNNNPTDQPPEMHPMLSYQDQMDDEINLIDLIYPIYRHRIFLILFCLVIVVAATIITLRTPKTYEATAVILPETKAGDSGSELKAAFLKQFGVAGIGGSTGAPSEVFEAVIKSNELAQEVRDRYHYGFIMGIKGKGEKKAAEAFAKAIQVAKDRNNPTISVSIQSVDPVLAADLANTYITALDRYNRTNTVTSAQRLRRYIEERMQTANQELDQAQKDLREFQENNRAVSISKQAEATLEVLSEMEADRVALEVEKAAKERFYRGPHIEIEQLKAQMEALQNNIDRLTYSDDDKIQVQREKGTVDFYIPLTRIPALNFDESKLLLKVKAKTGVVTMLTTQLEQAKLDETKDMPTINVLDWARPPERHIKPRLKLNVILSLVVSLFLGIFGVFLLEFIQRMDKDPETSPKWQEMKKGLINTIFFFKKTKYHH
ncbi:MAG: hypothetical protein JRC68_08660 [Deltaproteobacteria bacterium]|nr:hypothetical protein [Deltaproteobacteria bacterium]